MRASWQRLAIGSVFLLVLCTSDATHTSDGEERLEAHGEAAHGEHHDAAAHGAKHDTSHQGHHEHGHAPPSETGVTVSVMLLGSVAFVMALFYLVNWYDSDIRLYTWKMISATLSIFMAVLLFGAVKKAWHYFLAKYLGTPATGLLLFFLLWALAQLVLHLVRKDLASSLAQGTIWGHINGFAAIDAFCAIQEMAPFDGSPALMSLVLAIFVLVAVFLAVAGDRIRRTISLADGQVDSNEHRWMEHSEECENDMFALCSGFLTTMVVRYVVTSDSPSGHDGTNGKTKSEAAYMMIAGLVFAVLSMIATCLVRSEYASEDKSLKMRLAVVFQDYVSMSMAWNFYFGGAWLYYAQLGGHTELNTGKIVLALAFSVVCMFFVFIVDCISDGGQADEKSMRQLIVAMGVLVGLSWEHAFHTSLSTLADVSGHPAKVNTVIAVALVAVTMPAWRLYILPKADPELAEHYDSKLPPLLSIFVGWDPRKDVYSSKRQANRTIGARVFSKVAEEDPSRLAARSRGEAEHAEGVEAKGCCGGKACRL